MSEPLFLCLDQGGSASRAMVISGTGTIVAEARQPVATQRPAPGRVEHDAAEVVASVRTAAQQALAQLLAVQKQQLQAAALVTQRASLVCWNRASRQALTPVISWQDTRGRDLLARCALSPQQIQQRTGLVANAHLGASKYQWCLQHIPAVAQAMQQQQLAVGPLASYLVSQLCSAHPHVVDPANASRTLLWNIYRQNWDDELLAAFALPGEIFPQLKPTLCDFGELQFGDIRLPLRLLNGDQSSAIFGFGALLPETAYVNIGTGAFISQPLTTLPATIAPLLCSPALMTDETVYLLEGTVHGANSALYDWADKRALVMSPELLRDALQDPQPALFLNGVGGLGSPDWISDFPSRFIGAQQPRAQLAAILESIVFLLCRNFAVLQSRATISQLLISGGLSQLDGLCQRLADLTGVPVLRPRECEATALGAAFCLAGRPSQWPLLHGAQRFEPQPHPALLNRYRHWQQLMPH